MNNQRLCQAVREHNMALLRELIESTRFSVNEKCDCGSRPLELALDAHATDVVRLLLEHGAEVESADATDEWSHRNKGVIDLALVEAAHFDDFKKLETLLDAGVSVNYRNWRGWTLLARAIWNSIALVKCLLQRGVDPNLASVGNWTPLMCAVAVDISNLDGDDMLQEVELLLKAGASIVAVNDRGETAVDIVNRQCSIEEGIKIQARALLRGGN